MCSVYDIFYTKLLKNRFNIDFIYRNMGLIVAALTILYFRFWIMNFEGPIFAENDNPAAFADDFITRVRSMYFKMIIGTKASILSFRYSPIIIFIS